MICLIKGWLTEVEFEKGSKAEGVNAPEPVPPGKLPKLIFTSQTVGTHRPFLSQLI